MEKEMSDGDVAELRSWKASSAQEAPLEALARLAERHGVAIRVEPFTLNGIGGKGGLCRLRGKLVVIVDARLSTVEQAGVIGEALGQLGVHAPRDLRSYVETGHGPVGELLRLRPLARARQLSHKR